MDVLKKVPVREQDPKVRAGNFEEVCLGYNEEEAAWEASRCLNCKNAKCVEGCPVSIRIPEFIKKVSEGDLRKRPRLSQNPRLFLQSAEGCAPRRASVKENASGGLRGSLSP